MNLVQREQGRMMHHLMSQESRCQHWICVELYGMLESDAITLKMDIPNDLMVSSQPRLLSLAALNDS